MEQQGATFQDGRRQLPSVERLLAHLRLVNAGDTHGRALVVEAARAVLAQARAAVASGEPAPALDALAENVMQQLEATARGTLHPVINATGVIIHTNLGRAPLSRAARRAMDAVAAGYSNLEYDLDAGERGSRYLHAEALLCKLTGAEAALVVNNNAGAVFLVLSALAHGREVAISAVNWWRSAAGSASPTCCGRAVHVWWKWAPPIGPICAILRPRGPLRPPCCCACIRPTSSRSASSLRCRWPIWWRWLVPSGCLWSTTWAAAPCWTPRATASRPSRWCSRA